MTRGQRTTRVCPRPGTMVRQTMRLARLAGLPGTLLLLAGCATVVRGTHETFHIVSTPAGALAQLSTGESCTTPCAMEIARANPFQVRVAKPGFVTQLAPVRSVTSAAAGIALLSNGIIGGLVGASVDLSSGAMRNLTPNPVRVDLVPVAADPPVPATSPATTAVAPDPVLASSGAAPVQAPAATPTPAAQ